MGGLIGLLDRKLNRLQRPEVDRVVRGAILVLVVGAAAGGTGWALTWLSRANPYGWLVELALVISLVAQRGLFEHVRAVGRALRLDGVSSGREAVAHIVGRDVKALDGHGVSRAAIESCAENFADGVVAPVFWYVLFGLPGMLVYKAVNTMDSMVGYRNARYQAFGRVAARTDDVLNLVPARLAAVFLALAAAFVPTASPGAAFATMIDDARKHRSPNAGWPEAAMAGALGLALAGPRRYEGAVVEGAWIGGGSARAGPGDIDRALKVYAVACLINSLVVGVIAIIRLAT